MTGAIAIDTLGDHIGREAVSAWLTIEQERIDRFAEATGDNQWIHVDVARAERELGGTIAHGFLILSVVPLLARGLIEVGGVARRLNYGCDKVRFLSSVTSGQSVRLRQTIVGVDRKAGGTLLRTACTVEVRDADRPACAFDYLVMLVPERAE